MGEIGFFLPDTNILISAFLGREPFAEKTREWTREGRLLLSTIVIAELAIGMSGAELKKLEALAGAAKVMSVDLECALKAAAYRKTALKRKQKMHMPDCLIAAQAFLSGACLVTQNRKDYPQADIQVISL